MLNLIAQRRQDLQREARTGWEKALRSLSLAPAAPAGCGAPRPGSHPVAVLRLVLGFRRAHEADQTPTPPSAGQHPQEEEHSIPKSLVAVERSPRQDLRQV